MDAIELQNYVGSVIQGNFIGTDVTGTAKLGSNGGIGLEGGHGVTVGGTASGAGNVIAGSRGGVGMFIFASDTLVQGNYIGTDVTGTINLGNFGVGITTGADSNNSMMTTNNVIGGTAAHAGNTIAFNGVEGSSPAFGVRVNNSVTSILGNSIFSNTEAGIDTPGLPAPVLSGATSTTITGTYNGPASSTVRLEFFATPDTGHFYDNAQGKTLLGAGMCRLTASGHGSFTFTPPGGVPSGEFLTATATTAGGTSRSRTSSPLRRQPAPTCR